MIHMKKVTYIPIAQKEELESKKKKLKIAAYCRVSTLEEASDEKLCFSD